MKVISQQNALFAIVHTHELTFHMYVCTYVHMYVCIYECIYLCVYVCMHECIYMCVSRCVCIFNITFLSISCPSGQGEFQHVYITDNY